MQLLLVILFNFFFFQASQQADEKSTRRCFSVFAGILKVLQKNEINSRTAFNIVSLLLTEVLLL